MTYSDQSVIDMLRDKLDNEEFQLLADHVERLKLDERAHAGTTTGRGRRLTVDLTKAGRRLIVFSTTFSVLNALSTHFKHWVLPLSAVVHSIVILVLVFHTWRLMQALCKEIEHMPVLNEWDDMPKVLNDIPVFGEPVPEEPPDIVAPPGYEIPYDHEIGDDIDFIRTMKTPEAGSAGFNVKPGDRVVLLSKLTDEQWAAKMRREGKSRERV